MGFIYEVDEFKFNYREPAIDWLVSSRGLDDSPVSRSVDFVYFKHLLHFMEKRAEETGVYEDPWTGVVVRLKR